MLVRNSAFTTGDYKVCVTFGEKSSRPPRRALPYPGRPEYNPPVATRAYSLREKVVLGLGKLRRLWLVAFSRRTVETKLERRRGACNRCGACCKLLFQCPAYDESDGQPKCLIYNDRPGVCGLFPLDEADLRERDIVMPEQKCGFFFSDGPAPAKKGARPESMPVKLRFKAGDDEPKNGHAGRPSLLRAPFAILGAMFVRPGSGSTVKQRKKS